MQRTVTVAKEFLGHTRMNRWGVVGVDPGVIPLGTRLTIPSYGEAVAADTGPAVQGVEVDLWFPSVDRRSPGGAGP